MKQYLQLDRPASRQEFWAVYVISIVSGGVITGVGASAMFFGDGLIGGLALIAAGLFILYMQVAVAARRCRSADISPYWSALMVVPYLNLAAAVVVGSLKPVDQTGATINDA